MTINEFDDYISPMGVGGDIGTSPDDSFDPNDPWGVVDPTDDV